MKRAEKRRLKAIRQASIDAGNQGLLYNARGKPADFLMNMYQGAGVFLMGGGPSLLKSDLTQLDQRGIVTATMNQTAAVYRSNLWFSVDAQTQFCESIWTDPGIMKFTKQKYLSRFIHGWNGTDAYVDVMKKVQSLPNVWGFEHTDMGKTPWNPAAFLKQPSPTWGSTSKENDPEGKHYHKSVMLVALRLCYWLGFRRVYLLGCDFKQKTGNAYAFDQDATAGRAGSNNRLYGWLNRRFNELQPYFMMHGFEVFNCTPGGRLLSFPRLPLEKAVELEAARVPAVHTAGHYRA